MPGAGAPGPGPAASGRSAVDAMGSDFAPAAVVDGALAVARGLVERLREGSAAVGAVSSPQR